jgi:hypothetical protein
MKSKQDELTQRILLLLKIDANNLFRRIKERKVEYLEIFALRRTRTHFPMIFRNRYETTTLMDLAHCGPELITLLDEYYSLVEEMNWYLFQTEDMPGTVELYIDRKIKRMGKLLETLNMFLDAELGIAPEHLPEPDAKLFIDQPEDPFLTDASGDDTSQDT